MLFSTAASLLIGHLMDFCMRLSDIRVPMVQLETGSALVHPIEIWIAASGPKNSRPRPTPRERIDTLSASVSDSRRLTGRFRWRFGPGLTSEGFVK